MARGAHRRYRSTIVLQQSKGEIMGTASVTIRAEESTKRAVRALAEYLKPDKKPLK